MTISEAVEVLTRARRAYRQRVTRMAAYNPRAKMCRERAEALDVAIDVMTGGRPTERAVAMLAGIRGGTL